MPGGGASSGRLHRCAFSRSCHPAAYGSPTSGGYEAAPPTPRMGDLMGTRIGHAGFLALAVLLGASERGFAAACNGRGVPEALAAAQAQCCPARNHGAYVSCAAHLTNELVKQGKLQPSCKSLIFKAGCPAATTTTLQTTTTTAAPRTTTTSSRPVSTPTSTSAPVPSTTTTPASSTTSTTMAGGPTTTSSTAPAPTTTTTPGATSTTTTTLGTGPVPAPRDICGNCIDDDGNGLTDFEDPACCMQSQAFTMTVTHGLLRPRGVTTRLKLKSLLAKVGLADVDPLKQDVFVQIRPAGGTDVLCAKAPADKFMKMHGAFKFWDRHHHVASAKGISDIRVKVRRDGSVRFSAVGKRVKFSTPQGGTLQVTVGFRDPATAEAGNRCSTQTQAFRTGRQGQLLAPLAKARRGGSHPLTRPPCRRRGLHPDALEDLPAYRPCSGIPLDRARRAPDRSP